MRTPETSASALTACLAGFIAGLCLLSVTPARATCTIDRSRGDTGRLTVHVAKDCTEQEREAQAVSARELLEAIAAGRGVDLMGAVILGDVALDRLPARPFASVMLPPRVRDKLSEMHVSEVHELQGEISIHNARFRGSVKSNMDRNVVLARGPVRMTGTTFEQSIDFSRTVFLGPVDFSGAVFLQQGFFIEAVFDQPATFERTAFGPHSRFHKAAFVETVTFHRAGFNGLSEFIQVLFDNDARFSQVYFKMGTGFSGSQFHGISDFSEATFDREAFFSFAVFQGDAYFRRVTFRAEANFDDAQFLAMDDFSKTWFNVEPRFTRTRVNRDEAFPKGLQNPRVLYIIAATLLAFSLIFAFVLKKS
jgi:hypothetical protein